MRKERVIFLLVVNLSLVTTVPNWHYEDETTEQNYKVSKQFLKNYPMVISKEEGEVIANIIEKIENKDSNLTEIISDLENIVEKKSPSTPKNCNFTAIQQNENIVQEHETKVLHEKIRSKDFSSVDTTDTMRYKIGNASYWKCVAIVSTVGQVGGGVAGAFAGGIAFKAAPIIGIILGAAVGAFIGQLLGKLTGAALGKTTCIK